MKHTCSKEVADCTGPAATATSMKEVNEVFVEDVSKKTLSQITLMNGQPDLGLLLSSLKA